MLVKNNTGGVFALNCGKSGIVHIAKGGTKEIADALVEEALKPSFTQKLIKTGLLEIIKTSKVNEEKTLDKMNKEELLAYATQKEIKVPVDGTKKDIFEAIKTFEAGQE